MKVKIISSVFIDGKVFHPGTTKPTIVDVNKETAENLCRIKCGVDPKKSDINTERDFAKELEVMKAEFSAKDEEMKNMATQISTKDLDLEVMEADLSVKDEELAVIKAKLEKMAKVNQELLKKNEKLEAAKG